VIAVVFSFRAGTIYPQHVHCVIASFLSAGSKTVWTNTAISHCAKCQCFLWDCILSLFLFARCCRSWVRRFHFETVFYSVKIICNFFLTNNTHYLCKTFLQVQSILQLQWSVTIYLLCAAMLSDSLWARKLHPCETCRQSAWKRRIVYLLVTLSLARPLQYCKHCSHAGMFAVCRYNHTNRNKLALKFFDSVLIAILFKMFRATKT